jgi:hypothetical protein
MKPGTNPMDKQANRLQLVATSCWKLFEKCSQTSSVTISSGDADLRNTLVDQEYGKFKVWCGSLGVRQGGHASLDWRLKDADMMAHEILVMLRELEDDLGECKCHARRNINIARLTHIGLRLLTGDKVPYEQDDSLSVSSSDSDSTSPGEAHVRLEAIQSTIGTLYQMSHLVRNQRTRRLAVFKAQSYHPRDKLQSDVLESYASSDRARIDELFRELRRRSPTAGGKPEPQPLSRPDSDEQKQDGVLKARLLEATTARRRQLAYWKMHSNKLKAVADDCEGQGDVDESRTMPSATEATGLVGHVEYIPADAQSLTSFASTVRDEEGNETEFPGPPERDSDEDWFECPYCFVLCQSREAATRRWK